jgi:hypothetical protein
MITILGHTWTFKEIYQIWSLTPLLIKPSRRGSGEGIKQKKTAELAAHKSKTAEIKSFLASVGLRYPKTQAEVKLLYKELGTGPMDFPMQLLLFQQIKLLINSGTM